MSVEFAGYLVQVGLVLTAAISILFLVRYGLDSARQFHQSGLERVRAWEARQAATTGRHADRRFIA